MSVVSALIHLAREVVEGTVKPGLAKELNKLEQEVKSPIKEIANRVIGGTIWKGKSSEAFVRVVMEMVMPGLNVSSQHISTTQNNVQRAVEIMETADMNVNREVNKLADTFASIY